MRKLLLYFAVCFVAQNTAWADLDPWDYTFLLTAQTTISPPSITINWSAKPVSQIIVRRKLSTDAAWGPAVMLPGNATSFFDPYIEAGRAYEYEFQAVVKPSPQEIAYGYICAGAGIASVNYRGRVALIVDQTFSGALAGELETLRLDLIGDGWTVVRHDVPRNATPPQVKALIQAEYNAAPAEMRAVFLIGHVPVPYSGVINPDMHLNHLGAWPADVYYGDVDGAWTDNFAYKAGAEFDWNNNVPGDGKFDQSTTPSAVELEVGRVDFFDMPSFAPRTELELLRNYLNKNHRFRHRTLTTPLRGLIRDQFRVIDDDAPATDAWRCFPAMFGPGNYAENPPDQFFPVLQNQGYLFAYAGGGGDWEKADGVGTTADFATRDPQAIFYLLHGSYMGDWNTTDNFVRAAIATPNYGLVSIWSSLPHWYLHHLALGETIGFATRLTQNNRNGVYRNSADLSIGEVHTSMMGDPTLRPFPLAPASNLRISATDKITLTWNPSWQTIDGYHVYWTTDLQRPFQRINRGIIRGTLYEMPLPTVGGHYYYMVKAAALQTTGAGSFNNLSQGLFVEYDAGPPPPPPPLPQVSVAATDAIGSEDGDGIVFTFTRTNPIDTSLNVSFQFSGTSSLGEDFQAASTVTFQPGAMTASVTIAPTKDDVNELEETILVTLVASSAYNIANPSSATATIQPSGESKVTATDLSPAGGLEFNATGFANRPYRIESRTPTGAWRTRTSAVAGSNGAVVYKEFAAPQGQCELFRIVWE